MAKKGTVRDLSSLFPAEEVHKASMRVRDTITERHRELDRLKTFVDDNTNLINLVRKLPDETHHDIMVPFGPAAFFPGRMTNPNKFLVLLGEGYHAERSAKQTVEILKRRGKALETQVESLNAVMEDLKLEASFFDNTALESVEGLVEIREDYDEEDAPSSTAPTSGYKKPVPPLEVDIEEAAVEDEEYARIFARMAELEKEEEAEAEEAEETNMSDQDTGIQNEQDNSVGCDSTDQGVRSILARTREAPVVSQERASDGDFPARNSVVVNKDSELPQDQNKIGSTLPASTGYPTLNKAVVNKNPELPQEEKKIASPFPASTTAFTGSIVEHAHNVGANAPQQGGGRSSKPVSRFKMQRK